MADTLEPLIVRDLRDDVRLLRRAVLDLWQSAAQASASNVHQDDRDAARQDAHEAALQAFQCLDAAEDRCGGLTAALTEPEQPSNVVGIVDRLTPSGGRRQ